MTIVSKVNSHAPKSMGYHKKYLTICLAFLVAFLIVLLLRDNMHGFDQAVNSWMLTIQSGWVTTSAIGISYAFDTYSLLVATLIIACYLFYKNYKIQSLVLLGAMGGDALLVEAIKSLVQSPRPLNMIIVASDYSFPSGHTVGSIIFSGLLAYFAWQHWKTNKPRAVIIVTVASVAAVVGFDRIYLNVHWFSDVLGGGLLGVFWLTLSILIAKLLTADEKLPSNRFNKLSTILFYIAVIVALAILIESLLHL
jgi:membrane-associated phospholipid phosphatase